MTLQELNEYMTLGETIIRDMELLENLEAAALPGAQNLTGMPHAHGVKDRLGDLAAEIADMRTDISELEQEREKKKTEIEKFIRRIPDARIKLIFRLRFIRGLAWKEVAGILGRWNTEEGVKRAAYRYMDAYNPDQLTFEDFL